MKHPIKIGADGKIRNTFTNPLGWTVKEVIGMALVNPRGIKAGSLSVIIGE